jgi:predicted alpha/beta superfamily hydrolase
MAFSSNSQTPQVDQGDLVYIQDFKSDYVKSRPVAIWLPPNYNEEKAYPVVYMHDGQALFDARTTWNGQEWGVDEVLSGSFKEGLSECIVVGVWNGGVDRRREFFPKPAFDLLSDEGRKVYTTAQDGGGNLLLSGPIISDRYLQFLVEEVKTYVDKHYSTDPGREATFVMGSSHGGLISIYALCEYPEVFGGAACLSTHWTGLFEHNDHMPDALVAYLEGALPEPGKHRIYFDHGTETLDSLYGPYQKKVDAVMHSKGYSASWITRIFEGAAHTENDWKNRLHEPFTFLLNENK